MFLHDAWRATKGECHMNIALIVGTGGIITARGSQGSEQPAAIHLEEMDCLLRMTDYFFAPAAGTGFESATPTVDVATCNATYGPGLVHAGTSTAGFGLPFCFK